jgi:hypothetical protein
LVNAELTGAASDEPGAAADGVVAGADCWATADWAPGTAGSERSRGPSRVTRIRTFVRRGFTATFVVLVLFTAAIGIYAAWILPDTVVPQPQQSSIAIDFSSGHPASSPITVGITLSQFLDGIMLDIQLDGADLAHTGWSLYLTIPTGGQPFPVGTPQPVISYGDSGTDNVVIRPGPGEQSYETMFTWDNLHSGPMQIDGANLAAFFPDVQVFNSTSIYPKVSVTRELDSFGDYSYLGGQTPDHATGSAWWWTDEAYRSSRGFFVRSDSFRVEARSAATEAQANDAVFKSGVAFGVAAGALIAAIQEFVKSATESERQARRK